MEIVSLLLELISTTYSHNQDVMREMESGVILFITYYYGGGGGGGGGRTEVPLCSLSPLIAVDNLKLRIDCPPLNNE